jgi:hypothetical protein
MAPHAVPFDGGNVGHDSGGGQLGTEQFQTPPSQLQFSLLQGSSPLE